MREPIYPHSLWRWHSAFLDSIYVLTFQNIILLPRILCLHLVLLTCSFLHVPGHFLFIIFNGTCPHAPIPSQTYLTYFTFPLPLTPRTSPHHTQKAPHTPSSSLHPSPSLFPSRMHLFKQKMRKCRQRRLSLHHAKLFARNPDMHPPAPIFFLFFSLTSFSYAGVACWCCCARDRSRGCWG